MSKSTFCSDLLKELEAETTSSRKCLERIPSELFGWKPHERSMETGYLALIVAEIPKWIQHTIDGSEIDFATFQHAQPKSGSELAKHFDENLQKAKQALERATDEALKEPFALKNSGQLLVSSTKREMLAPMINHLVHHRGQLTIYMRLNNIPVPSIYGPSADDRSF